MTRTSDKILDCARTLILAGGYNGFSYADIAETIGIRKPSIHHHFPSKMELVRALVARYRDEAKAGFAHLDHQSLSPLEELRAYSDYWKQCITDASAPYCLCALLASELPALPEAVELEVREFFRTLSAWLTSVFERGVQEGNLRLSSTPVLEAETFMATVHGAMLSARAYGSPAIFGAIISPLLERLSASSATSTTI